MKKFLLQYIMLLVPFFAAAQSNPTVYKDFAPKIKGIVHSFKLDDHTSVIQTNLDGENFELIAIDDKGKILWRTALKGYAIGTGKFRGHILAVASVEHSASKGPIGPYTGFLINAQTGKLTLQKTIYEGGSKTFVILDLSFN